MSLPGKLSCWTQKIPFCESAEDCRKSSVLLWQMVYWQLGRGEGNSSLVSLLDASRVCSQQWMSYFYRENTKPWLSYSKTIELVSGPFRVQTQNCSVVIVTGFVLAVVPGCLPELTPLSSREHFCHCSHSADQKLNNMVPLAFLFTTS